MKKIFSFLVLIIFIFISSIFYFNVEINKKQSYNTVLEIDKNKPLKVSLNDFNLSKNLYFKLYLKYRNGGKDIKAGYYIFNGDYSIKDILDILEEGRDKYFKFTIIEGMPSKDIFNNLVLAKRGDMENFEKALKDIYFPYPTPNNNFEGYFYPTTYYIPENASEEDIVKIFLREFLKKFPEEKYKNKEDFYQKLIMGSIIEREAKLDEEKPLMASVFYNRIKKGMTLSADSTINFLFDYKKKRIFYKDLEVDSPYNTYKYKGLPPAPISNPTKISVDAAYNPADTDFLFFVTTDGKRHFFSNNYKEHLEYQRRNK